MADRWRDQDRYRRGYGGGGYGGEHGRYGGDAGRNFGPGYGEEYDPYRGGGYGGPRGDFERDIGREYGRGGYGGYGREIGGGYGREGGGYGGGGDFGRGPGTSGYDRDYGDYGRDYGDYGRSGMAGSSYGRDYDYDRYGAGEAGFGTERYGGSRYGTPGGRGYGREGQGRGEERDWMDRTGDEVRSWFGDEEAEHRRRMDQHRVRGPKGYTRSDDRIREDVCDRLSDDPTIDASEIEVRVSDGEVMLSGTVDDRGDKRRAEDCAESVSGVRNVQNTLRIEQGTTAVTGARRTGTTASTTGGNVSGTTAGTATRQRTRQST